MIDTSTKITKVTSQLIYSRIRKNCNIVCLMQLKSRSYMLMKIIKTPNIAGLERARGGRTVGAPY